MAAPRLPPPLPRPFGQEPPRIRLVHKGTRGRALIATETINPGEVLFAEAPILIYPHSRDAVRHFCSHCFTDLQSKEFRCPTCHVALFCSEQCLQRSHPSRLCHALPSILTGTAFTLSENLFFLLCAYSLDQETLNKILYLDSNSRIPQTTIKYLHAQLESLFTPSNCPPNFSLQTTISLVSICKKNSFTLLYPVDQREQSGWFPFARASAIYLWGSMVNHDCRPNICPYEDIYFDYSDNTSSCPLVFKSVQTIDAGSELCSSYIGVGLTYQVRRRRLLEVYNFHCYCSRCGVERVWKENIEGEEQEETIEEKNSKFLQRRTGIKMMCGQKGKSTDYDRRVAEFVKKHECRHCGGFIGLSSPQQMECNGCRHEIYTDDLSSDDDA